MRIPRTARAWLAIAALAATTHLSAAADTGIFSSHADVGIVSHPGDVAFDAAAGSYLITGGGANMWGTNDAFHFVWKEVRGDFDLAADIEWLGAGGDPHRKACLMIRSGTGAGAAYVDAALHGDGLTSLQFREVEGGPTHEVQAPVRGPKRLRLERRAGFITLSTAAAGGSFEPSGCAFKFTGTEPLFVGLAVCSHNDAVVERARFSGVALTAVPSVPNSKPVMRSVLEVVPIGSKDRRVVWHSTNLFEAPNWSRDGQQLIINSQGKLYRVPVVGPAAPVLIDTRFATRCNNDHGLSPDGSQLVISDQSQGDRKSIIYVLPATGGTPRRVTALGPSYWHGWSPDGKTLVYCAERGGEYDLYSISVDGGEERRLTREPGLDDGPDYSPDGRHIYFNSERSGRMQIWRVNADGTEPARVTQDDFANWFPHPSPDGRWLVYLAYGPKVQGHPANEDVWLRLLPLGGGPVQTLVTLHGGQGTLNVPSWSPDSRQVAFVSYHPVPVISTEQTERPGQPK